MGEIATALLERHIAVLERQVSELRLALMLVVLAHGEGRTQSVKVPASARAELDKLAGVRLGWARPDAWSSAGSLTIRPEWRPPDG